MCWHPGDGPLPGSYLAHFAVSLHSGSSDGAFFLFFFNESANPIHEDSILMT